MSDRYLMQPGPKDYDRARRIADGETVVLPGGASPMVLTPAQYFARPALACTHPQGWPCFHSCAPFTAPAGTFRRFQRVLIHYKGLPTRNGTVVRDDGGAMVLVEWVAGKTYAARARRERAASQRALLAPPRKHQQWFPRERLEMRTR